MRRSDQRRAAVVALYQSDVTGRALGEVLERRAPEFTRELAEGAKTKQDDLDALITRFAEGWTLDRIAPVERNIMRIALYELIHRADVPDEVAIDEAVEAAKELCGADAPKFINGILGSVQRERAQNGAVQPEREQNGAAH